MSTEPNRKTATDSHEDPDHIIIGLTRQTKRFLQNLTFVNTWTQYEALELIFQGVELADVSIPWLEQFRERLEPQP